MNNTLGRAAHLVALGLGGASKWLVLIAGALFLVYLAVFVVGLAVAAVLRAVTRQRLAEAPTLRRARPVGPLALAPAAPVEPLVEVPVPAGAAAPSRVPAGV